MTPAEIETAIGTLPDKLSDLLEVALDDFEKVTKLPNVEFNVMTYCKARDGKCLVCLAGCVMAARVGVPHILEQNDILIPSDFPNSTRRKLDAISDAALGCTGHALRELGFEKPEEIPESAANSTHADELIPEMRSLITLLRTHGL